MNGYDYGLLAIIGGLVLRATVVIYRNFKYKKGCSCCSGDCGCCKSARDE